MRADIKYNNIIDNDEARVAQAEADKAPGLPADEINADKYYITQHYWKYTRENHDVWQEMYDKRWTVLEQQVSRIFIEGMKILKLSRDRLPLLDDWTADRDIEIAGGVKVNPPEICAGVKAQTPPPRSVPALKLAPVGTPVMWKVSVSEPSVSVSAPARPGPAPWLSARAAPAGSPRSR